MATPSTAADARPGVRWGATEVSVSQETLAALLRRAAARLPDLEQVAVELREGELAVEASVRRYGVSLPVRVVMARVALVGGRLLLEIDRVRALSLVPVPDRLLEWLAGRAAGGLVDFDRGGRRLAIDLRRWLPVADLSSEEVALRPGELTLRLRAGGADLADLLSG